MLPGGRPVVKVNAGCKDRVVERYQELVSTQVRWEDLVFDEDLYTRDARDRMRPAFEAGDLNPWNRWNVGAGIMHLSHPANTLGEEVQLVGDATVLRRGKNRRLLQAAKCLLCCGGFGDVNRSSDPAIGAAVNELVRAGLDVTIANPVGLYMSHLEDAGWTKPDGALVSPGYWQPVRMALGTPGLAGTARTVRAVYEVPDGEMYRDADGKLQPLQVGDLRIDGQPIRYPGQVAAAIRMVCVLAAWPALGQLPEAIDCEPEYRCCRRPDPVTDFLSLEQSTGDRIRAVCAPGHVDAFLTASMSADRRLAYLKTLPEPLQPGGDGPPDIFAPRRGRRGTPPRTRMATS
jgi:hypothetical protein